MSLYCIGVANGIQVLTLAAAKKFFGERRPMEEHKKIRLTQTVTGAG
jgi:hypothetical protein